MRRVFWCLVAAGSAASLPGQAPIVQRGVAVSPDSVTVGDPFRIVVRIRAPRGATIEFPSLPDSSTGVEALDPVQVAIGQDTTVVEQTATYRVAAWDVGVLPIRFPDILVREADRTRRVSVGSARVVVASVLPADSTLRVPKPPRALLEFGLPWWLWLLVALVVAALFAPVVWLYKRRQRARRAAPDPYEEAVREFARIEELGLIGAGERGHYVAVVTDVMRTYLARVIAAAPTSRTTAELSHALRGDPRVPLTRLVRLLHDADLVKFARQPVSDEQALGLGQESRHIVDGVHEAVVVREQPNAEEKAA
jgi:hypothetical protein